MVLYIHWVNSNFSSSFSCFLLKEVSMFWSQKEASDPSCPFSHPGIHKLGCHSSCLWPLAVAHHCHHWCQCYHLVAGCRVLCCTGEPCHNVDTSNLPFSCSVSLGPREMRLLFHAIPGCLPSLWLSQALCYRHQCCSSSAIPGTLHSAWSYSTLSLFKTPSRKI